MRFGTTQRGETLRQAAARKAKEKAGDAVDAVNPVKRVRGKLEQNHQDKGGAMCIGCGKPIKGVKANKGNVHNKAKCQTAAAKRFKSVMD